MTYKLKKKYSSFCTIPNLDIILCKFVAMTKATLEAFRENKYLHLKFKDQTSVVEELAAN